jgi:hypothetical protein
MTATSLLVLALLAPAPPAPAEAAPPPPVQGEERDLNLPPPGASAEDQAIWTAVRDGTGHATFHMARIAQAAFRIRYGHYYEELDRKGDPAAKSARARLEAAAKAAEASIPPKPNIYPCRHVLLNLDVRLAAASDPKAQADLPEVRADARRCGDEMAALISKVRPAADELEASLAGIDALLGRMAPPAPDGVLQPGAHQAGAALQDARPQDANPKEAKP